MPALGQLSGADMNGARTPAVGEMALRFRLAAAHADLSTIALVDIDGKRELAALAAGLMQSLQASSADGGVPGHRPAWPGGPTAASAGTRTTSQLSPGSAPASW